MANSHDRLGIIVLGWALGLAIGLAAAFNWIDKPRSQNDRLLLYTTAATAGGGLIAGAMTGAAMRQLSSGRVLAHGLVWGGLMGADMYSMARLFPGYSIAIPFSVSSIAVGLIGGALSARITYPLAARRQIVTTAIGWALALFVCQWIFILFSSTILRFLMPVGGEELVWLLAGGAAGAFAGLIGGAVLLARKRAG